MTSSICYSGPPTQFHHPTFPEVPQISTRRVQARYAGPQRLNTRGFIGSQQPSFCWRCRAQAGDSTHKCALSSPARARVVCPAAAASSGTAPPQESTSTPSTNSTQTDSSTNGSHDSSDTHVTPSRQRAKEVNLQGLWGLLPRLLVPPWVAPKASLGLLSQSTQQLKDNLWPVLLVYAVKDTLSFLLHRISQRLTNAGSDLILGTHVSLVANPWFLYLDPAFIEANVGYQVFIAVFFLAALPLNIMLNSAAATLAALICTAPPPPPPPGTPRPGKSGQASARLGGSMAAVFDRHSEAASHSTQAQLAEGAAAPEAPPAVAPGAPEAAAAAAGAPGAKAAEEEEEEAAGPPPPGLMAQLWEGVRAICHHAPQAAAMVKRVWRVDLAFNVRALPLQALSLAVLPVWWAVPRLMALQLALPAAIMEGHDAAGALGRSAELMGGLRAAYGWPFVAITLVVRVLDVVRNGVLAAMPRRWWQDVIEVPLLITAAFALAKMMVMRLLDLLPLSAYLIATSPKPADTTTTATTASASSRDGDSGISSADAKGVHAAGAPTEPVKST